MGRILSIDFGKKRVGLAVSDPLKLIANRLATVDTNSIWKFLSGYFQSEQVDEVIIGYPVQLNNQPSEAVLYVEPFIKRFREVYPSMKLELVDERFTSGLALRTMIDGGVKRMARRNKAMVDAISATIILQSYMEQQRKR